MKKIKIILLILVSLIILVILGSIYFYKSNLKCVNKSGEEVIFTVKENETFSTLADDLKNADLIRNEFVYKLYVKLNKPTNLQKGDYKLNKNMNVKEIIDILDDGSNYAPSFSITFNEGFNMRKFVKKITSYTYIKEEDIYKKLSDNFYLDKLITNYWFLNADIKNKDIYYSLEGYLYPDTYSFKKDATIEEIIEKMLDNTDKKLSQYRSKLENNKLTIHEVLTLASIVELESVGNDRSGVASVFINRLNSNWSLGSDVTTYYAAKIDMSERDLYKSELDEYNAYNTRSSKMAGKLPVGPICNPSVISIEAVLNPTKENYYYFVADKNKKTYYSKTYNEHLNTIARLKREGLWYIYQD